MLKRRIQKRNEVTGRKLQEPSGAPKSCYAFLHAALFGMLELKTVLKEAVV